MLKTVGLVFAGLAAGLAIAWWAAPGAPAPSVRTDADAAPAAVARLDARAPDEERLAALEEALASESAQRVALEARVLELAAQFEELGRVTPTDRVPAPRPDSTRNAVLPGSRGAVTAEMVEALERRQVERFIEAGFAPDRAEWLHRRTEELRMESMEAQHQAAREGRPLNPAADFFGDRTLRAELGDADYERYLQAMGRPTSLAVTNVLASSPAERAGLKPGDEVISYGGERVFDGRGLNALTLEGTAGESVVVEVRRDGQVISLVMPRGPIGISNEFRGPPLRGR